MIAVGILTHNLLRFRRKALFEKCLKSLVEQQPAKLFIVSNGSDDGTAEYVGEMGGTVINDPISTCGHGMNVTIGICAASGADLVCFTNDDILWKPGALDAIERFWSEAPQDVVLASGLLEDEYPWNTVRERVDYGGIPGLVRDTAPGGSWTMRAADWPRIAPIPEAAGWDDVPTCERLKRRGLRVVQLELAEHMGQHASTWGNTSQRLRKPLDRAAWGLEPAGTMTP